MIVCSCNFLSDEKIKEAVLGLLNDDEWQLISPGLVYHALKRRGRCCNCFPDVVDIIVSTSEAFHQKMQTPEKDISPFVGRIRDEHLRCETARKLAAMARRQDRKINRKQD